MGDPTCELCGHEQGECHCGDWESQRFGRSDEDNQGLKFNKDEEARKEPQE